METLTDIGSEIHSYLVVKGSPKKLKRSKTIFYTQKYVDYDYTLNPTIDDFIEQVSFSIRGCYVEGGYALKLYSLGGKLFCNGKSDDVYLTKEDCINSLGKDPIGSYLIKRKQHYKNSLACKIDKIESLKKEIEDLQVIIKNINK